MTDNKDKSNPNKQNNPFGRFNQNKKNDGKPPKFNAYWIYGIIAVVFIIVQYYVTNTRGPIETNWSKVKTTSSKITNRSLAEVSQNLQIPGRTLLLTLVRLKHSNEICARLKAKTQKR